MDRKMKCPICKKNALFVGVHDDEGNYHGLVGCDYESDPWSGLSYALHHEGWGDCPLCTDGAYSTMGGMLFDTAEEAINALTQPNEWVSVEERLPQLRENVLVCAYWHEHWGVYIGWNNGHGWTVSCGIGQRNDVQVSHWMLLPAPPEKEE